MKKTLLVSLILLSWILLTACGKKSQENVVEPEETIQQPEVTVEVKNCEEAVQKYLDWSDKEWKGEEIKEWDNIVVDYIWRLEDWTVFDTSIESIAKECGVYSEGRDYTQWLSFEVWARQMITWFDNWVVWMKLWQTKTVGFWPEDWYWKYDESGVITMSASDIWDLSQFVEWEYIDLWMWMSAKIVKVTDKDMTIDLNHELAGKNLIFDITIKSIN